MKKEFPINMEQTELGRKNWVVIPPALGPHFDRAHSLAVKVSAMVNAIDAIFDDESLRGLCSEMIHKLGILANELDDALDTPERFAQVAA